MCGICGIFNFGDGIPVSSEKLFQMTRAITHRGPDDEGFHIEGDIGLGFRRLSIIDISGGKQPMTDSHRTIWVVFNGEIYNFKELRKELESFGFTFRTRSDTEVIVYGYKKWGIDVLEKLNGMFGLAIWDSINRRLVLARDRAGIKPVYYYLDNKRLLFGSEIKAILPFLDQRPEPDTLALNQFLRFRYTPAPLTIFKGIRKLAAGERMIVENGATRIESWWNYCPVQSEKSVTIKDASDNLLELYKNAVKRQLVSDVPVGSFLSGGLDSGLLLALMNLYGGGWKTYTVGFGQSYPNDELAMALETAKFLHASNYGVHIDQQEYERSLSEIIGILEEPIASQSVVPMFYVSKRARQDVKVALIGQGPDELLGGYKRHLGVFYGSIWRNLPGFINNFTGALLKKLPRNEPIKRGLYSLNEPDRLRRYQNVFSIMPDSSIDNLFIPDYLKSMKNIENCWENYRDQLEQLSELNGFQYIEIRSALPDELLMYSDKVSMHHGLEVRVPYLDQEIIAYAESLPANLKIRFGKTKWLHRELCRKYLPAHIINRKKIGFAGDVTDGWFRKAVAGRMSENLKDPKSLIFDYLKYSEIQKLLRDHRNSFQDNHKILYSLSIFEEWLRYFCDTKQAVPEPSFSKQKSVEEKYTA